MKTNEVKITDWHGCYDGEWQGMIVPEAFAHPAKFSYALICRIVRHGLDQGYWKPGDLIGDCFGGVALGGVVCGYHDLNWVGVELEPRFVELGNKNLAMHGPRWMAMESAVSVRLLQGDSRRFAEVVGEVAGVVSSPPYAEQCVDGKRENRAENLENAGIDSRAWLGSRRCTQVRSDGYGSSPGQIGSLKSGSLDGVVTSPPYGDQNDHERPLDSTRNRNGRHKISLPYGTTQGNLGNLKTGELQCCSVCGKILEHTGPKSEPNSSPGGLSARSAPASVQPSGAALCAEDEACRSARTAETKSDAALDGAENAVESTSATPSKADRNRKTGSGKSPPAISTSPTLSTTPRTIETGAAETTDGEASPGESNGEKQSIEMAENAAAAELISGSLSTTKKTSRKPAASGITHSTTSKPSAEHATTGITPETHGHSLVCARCADLGSSPEYQPQKPALPSAERDSTHSSINAGSPKSDDEPDTYWRSMAIVYSSMRDAMKHGGVAAIVIKDYVSKKARVPLCDQTCTLLESVGFEVFERCRCWLVKEKREPSLFGGEHVTTKERKSFFRRLAEKKGSPKIDWEEVIWVKTT